MNEVMRSSIEAHTGMRLQRTQALESCRCDPMRAQLPLNVRLQEELQHALERPRLCSTLTDRHARSTLTRSLHRHLLSR